MGIWDHLFDSDYSQREDIEKLRARIRKAAVGQGETNARLRRRIEELEGDLAESALLLRSLFVYLKSQPGFAAKRFQAIVARIDAMDGTADGKATKPRRRGPATGR